MSGDHDIEQLLSSALRDEAAEVDIDPRALQEIQARTDGARVVSLSDRRRTTWLTPLLVAGAAAATVFGVVTLVQGGSSDVASPAATSASPASDGLTVEAASTSTQVFYVAKMQGNLPYRVVSEPSGVDQPDGPFHEETVRAFFDNDARDPQYSTLWPAGVTFVKFMPMADRGYTEVYLQGDVDISARHGLAPEASDAAIDAFVRTADLGPRLKVYYNGTPVKVLLGRRIDGFASMLPKSQALNPVQITWPQQGARVGSSVKTEGTAQVFEGTLTWELRGPRTEGATGLPTNPEGSAGGYLTMNRSDKRGTWSHTFTDLTPGTYELKVYEQSPENGEPTYVDSKEFTVQ